MPFGQVGGGYQYDDGNLNEVTMTVMPDPPAAKTGAGTLTVAELTGGVVVTNFGSALALTTPTGAQIDAALGNAKVGSAFSFAIVGTGAFANTLTGGTGVTVVGAAATPTTTIASAAFVFRKTGPGLWTAYRVS
jgi:hypothetical protein